MSINTMLVLASTTISVAMAQHPEIMDMAGECYSATFRYVDALVVDEEIAECLAHAHIQKIIRALEAKGLSEWQLENELDNLPEIDPNQFIGRKVYALCNYKGEGEGYSFTEDAEHLPVFMSKSHSFALYGC
jgi:hypothetical protein